ncbi:hypothetical protein [Paraburkholderia sp. Ac-20347]|jgi:hypothetical protein|uniref:hypothetical protein n=1 Tax=Paraburkholderia sp. Ac-20347 TaxID=2703892 RepID=UPI0019814078|nr:hypothetical protein [Paraburkholderia sp. Ac-20347]MBN3813488.1 hypothetical protein [Paraburkholderia sp. Ac-20347]
MKDERAIAGVRRADHPHRRNAAKSPAMRICWRRRATYEIIAALAAFRLSAFTITAMPVLFPVPFLESSADLPTFTPAAAAARRP